MKINLEEFINYPKRVKRSLGVRMVYVGLLIVTIPTDLKGL